MNTQMVAVHRSSIMRSKSEIAIGLIEAQLQETEASAEFPARHHPLQDVHLIALNEHLLDWGFLFSL